MLFRGFLRELLLVMLGLLLVGYLPTRRLGGDPAVLAMVVACAVTTLASALGGIPMLVAEGEPRKGLQIGLLAMILRLAVVVSVGAAAGIGLGLSSMPYLLWLGVSYLVLLAVDTRFMLRAQRRWSQGSDSGS